MISTNAILLEDVIRTDEGDDYKLVKEGVNFDDKAKGLNLIVNTERLKKLKSVFTGQNQQTSTGQVNGLISMAIEPSEQGLKFAGTSLGVSDANTSALPKSAAIKVENFIPSSATVIKWFGLENNQETKVQGFRCV